MQGVTIIIDSIKYNAVKAADEIHTADNTLRIVGINSNFTIFGMNVKEYLARVLYPTFQNGVIDELLFPAEITVDELDQPEFNRLYNRLKNMNVIWLEITYIRPHIEGHLADRISYDEETNTFTMEGLGPELTIRGTPLVHAVQQEKKKMYGDKYFLAKDIPYNLKLPNLPAVFESFQEMVAECYNLNNIATDREFNRKTKHEDDNPQFGPAKKTRNDKDISDC